MAHITYEDSGRVFKLFAGRSLYAMRISESGSLERLYWGKALPPNTDLRYLNRSNVAQPFDPTVSHKDTNRTNDSYVKKIVDDRMSDPLAKALRGASGDTDPLAMWKAHRGAADGEQAMKISHADSSVPGSSAYERRLENIGWRLLAMKNSADPSDVAESMFGATHDDSLLLSGAKRHGMPRTGMSYPNLSGNAHELIHEEEPPFREVMALDLPVSDSQLTSVSHRSRKLSVGDREDSSMRSPILAPTMGEIDEQLNLLTISQPQMEQNERVGKNMSLLEVADMGTGDYRQPSFVVEYSTDGSTISPLSYVSHEIIPGKAPVPSPMPHVRAMSAPRSPDETTGEVKATTLIVTMKDLHTGLVVEAHFTAMHDLEVIVRRLVMKNETAEPVRLKRCMSATVDFDIPLHNYWMTQLDGSWARERHVRCRKLEQGMTAFGSQRGTSSHQHCPFLVISEGNAPPEEENGTVYGFSLVYSGSFLAEAEVVDVGRLRVNIGVQPQGFTWHLAPGDEFSSPECVCTFSSEGIGEMSRQFHSLVREHLIPPQWRHVQCPVLCNTWEAEYFNVSHDSVVAMARAARVVGVEMIVLDDGWFGRRNDITSSLGDWAPNTLKFPFGIRGLAHDVNAEGMQFGLWIEPEMVSVDSALYRAHPDWCFQVPGRPRNEGRNQLVLDLTRSEVRDYVFESIAVTLREANVVYVKWDMNRHLTEAFSVSLPSHRQGEVLHRYVLGVYDLHERFTSTFPHVRFEACSGGGGRFDFGMLYFCPQVWASDNTDALMRMKIQHGSSYLFPSMTVGAHFSTVPNHITQGHTRKRTRALVAMCGTFGYELDLRKCADSADALRQQVAAHKLVHHIVRDGHLYRLWDPFRVNYCAWQYVLRKKQPDGRTTAESAAVFAFNRSSTFWSNLMPRLLLRGLDEEALYDVCEPLPNNRMQKSGTLEVVRTDDKVYQLGASCVRMNGATLMHAGIPVRFLTQDDSMLFLLKRVRDTPLLE